MLPSVLLAFAAIFVQPAQPLLTLEIRVFAGSEDVTTAARVTLHRAGERGSPVAQIAHGDARSTFQVPPGLYDAQAVQEREGRVVNIRWAERLVVMPYPDEAGHHLEVINFSSGYGALQIRKSTDADEVALFGAGQRSQPLPSLRGSAYTLFVVPAGPYDIQLTRGARVTWFSGIDVPRDRTRLWMAPAR